MNDNFWDGFEKQADIKGMLGKKLLRLKQTVKSKMSPSGPYDWNEHIKSPAEKLKAIKGSRGMADKFQRSIAKSEGKVTIGGKDPSEAFAPTIKSHKANARAYAKLP